MTKTTERKQQKQAQAKPPIENNQEKTKGLKQNNWDKQNLWTRTRNDG